MIAQTAPSAARRNGWTVAAQRLGPYLDPAIGLTAAVLAVVALLGADPSTIDPRLRDPDAVAVIATLAAAGSLAWRRRRPLTSFAVMVAGCLVVTLADHYIGLLSVLFLLSLYSLAAHGRRRRGLAGFGIAVACFVGLALLDVPDLGTSVLLQSLALLVAAWALGDAVRSRREQQRVQQREQVEAAVTDERLHIARELHDVVAHSMSLIAVQAGVGAYVIRSDVAAAERSLEVIADTSRRALEQTRAMLGMLREAPEGATRPPAQGLHEISALVEDMRAAGLTVQLTGPSAMPDLDAAASLAAYRIVQESLTNIIKHSASATATVTLNASPTGLSIQVVDPGPTRPEQGLGPGHGLLGLRERVRLLAGTLDVGPHDAGFRVLAVLPLGARR
ncbi:two-component sensor histidine kinase [Aeromicrobium sp. A1-2]|uniref:sensor histidine kinase n=1 Tax=Aeromicrobium sp. A1-2 TaxID=2107713 RepID=UPI000E522622|nr:histidine kinase [Aeromicrobium sp. A1-2]AXT85767.1 two-component sensor histidine kinase [Aeromicrobium sp. A1-2]